MLTHLTIILLTTLTVMQCLVKWKFFDWYGAKYGHVKWSPDAGCFLCFSFWLAIPVAVVYIICACIGHVWLFHYWFYVPWLFVPFACAGVINFIMTILSILSSGNNRII